MDIHEKYENLKNIIKNYGSLAVAFSGGVDSTFLLKTAHDVLGDKVIAVTAQSCLFPVREFDEAKDFCEKENIKHIICLPAPLSINEVANNNANRCYLCKSEIMTKIKQAAEPYNIKYIAEGTNFDDDTNDRPGFQAVKEHGIKSPLKEAGLTKAEIRELSKELSLPTWDKPSFACLASRFVFGEKITEKKLSMVDKAEQLLYNLGFTQFRVRIHENGKNEVARIEINPKEFEKILEPDTAKKIHAELLQYGFTYVTLDLGGYRTGSMNETLAK
ncbi:MAG: ATP-dependent sacrificial sulfur transferase LarE [Oscillospiraceae bacterium]|nr:ATP-dependent sacrificial sulfur transferase LarE [Oscillospiraceae bacterium]